MRIAILTAGRFHVLDLARELAKLGHDVRFYSILDRSRTRKYGLPDACNRWLGPIPAGLAYAYQKAPKALRPGLDLALTEAVDRIGALRLEPCDVFIGMAGMSLRTMDKAKSKYGATVICERSSQHILAQRDIIASLSGGKAGVSDHAVKTNLAEYERADYISVPAWHVVRSFEAHGIPRSRLLRNPFGTNLETFAPTPPPPKGTRQVVMAGGWSLQKGCDVLTEAWRLLPKDPATTLLHVGGVHDAPVPTDPGFTAAGFVPQPVLRDHYAKSNVFALASRQEGLAVVQVQALASGLPLVCTENTGGEDLREFLDDPGVITVVPVDDAPALSQALADALDKSDPDAPIRDLLGEARRHFSWAGYAQRWDTHIKEITA